MDNHCSNNTGCAKKGKTRHCYLSFLFTSGFFLVDLVLDILEFMNKQLFLYTFRCRADTSCIHGNITNITKTYRQNCSRHWEHFM